MKILILLSFILLTGCSTFKELELSESRQVITEAKIDFEKKEPMYIKIHKKNDKLLLKKIIISSVNTTLFSAIDYIAPGLTISPDSSVNLAVIFNVKFNGTLEQYFDYLSNLSGYHINLIGKTIYVKSTQEKTWHLQSLSLGDVSISGESGEGGEGDADIWTNTVENLRTLLGEGAIVIDSKKLGTITAIGVPNKIKQADVWLSELIKSSNKQIHLKVKILDVTIDESVGQGIDWNLLYKDYKLSNSSGSSAIDSAGKLTVGFGDAEKLVSLGSNIGLYTMIKLLRKQGDVRVDNQPNITISNGRTASISTGDEFSYIASTSSIVNNENAITTTANVVRTSVGVSMEVTPKILADNRIAINVVPVVSSIKGFVTLGSGTTTFKTPNVTLQKLATQVIIPSGETIHLGGLIAEKLVNNVKGLPKSNVFSFLFNGSLKSLERREIVILITPTIIDI